MTELEETEQQQANRLPTPESKPSTANEVLNGVARRHFKKTFGSNYLPRFELDIHSPNWNGKYDANLPYNAFPWKVVDKERYQVTGRLGSGGKAIVYEAKDTKTGESVAAKVIDKSLLGEAPFTRYSVGEGEATAQFDIDDPRVVAVKEFFVVDSLTEGPKAVIV